MQYMFTLSKLYHFNHFENGHDVTAYFMSTRLECARCCQCTGTYKRHLKKAWLKCWCTFRDAFSMLHLFSKWDKVKSEVFRLMLNPQYATDCIIYRLITAYLLLRMNLDKIMHAR